MQSLAYAVRLKTLSAGKKTIYIHISGWHTFNFGCERSLIGTRWHRWHSIWMWHRFWCWLSELLWWRCTHAFAPPAGLNSLYCEILARKAAIRLMVPRHTRVSFHRSFHICVPQKLNPLHPLFSDFSPTFLDQVLRFLYSRVRKPSYGHFGHIQCKAHTRQF